MISLGKKDNYSGKCEAVSPEKNKIRYPSFYISGVDLGLGEEDVGKELIATVKLKVTRSGTQINTDEKGTKKSEDSTIEVLGIEFKGIKGNKPNANWSTQEIMAHLRKEK